MGWWKIDSVKNGQIAEIYNSDGLVIDCIQLYNGDDPADHMGEAVELIAHEYKEHLGRWPRAEELHACLNFTINHKLKDGFYISNKKKPVSTETYRDLFSHLLSMGAKEAIQFLEQFVDEKSGEK